MDDYKLQLFAGKNIPPNHITLILLIKFNASGMPQQCGPCTADCDVNYLNLLFPAASDDCVLDGLNVGSVTGDGRSSEPGLIIW